MPKVLLQLSYFLRVGLIPSHNLSEQLLKTVIETLTNALILAKPCFWRKEHNFLVQIIVQQLNHLFNYEKCYIEWSLDIILKVYSMNPSLCVKCMEEVD